MKVKFKLYVICKYCRKGSWTENVLLVPVLCVHMLYRCMLSFRIPGVGSLVNIPGESWGLLLGHAFFFFFNQRNNLFRRKHYYTGYLKVWITSALPTYLLSFLPGFIFHNDFCICLLYMESNQLRSSFFCTFVVKGSSQDVKLW